MNSTFALVGRDFALVAADASAARSILVFKHDEDKILELDSHKLLVGVGVPADCANFNEYIQKNLKLYELNNDSVLSTHGVANYIRGELATALRKGPYQTNLLLAGYDVNDGVSLYRLDYMAALSKVNFGAHGYAANFVLSVFDRDWKKNMTLEEGLDVLRRCIHELKTRFLISQPVFIIKLVDSNGTRTLTDIETETDDSYFQRCVVDGPYNCMKSNDFLLYTPSKVKDRFDETSAGKILSLFSSVGKQLLTVTVIDPSDSVNNECVREAMGFFYTPSIIIYTNHVFLTTQNAESTVSSAERCKLFFHPISQKHLELKTSGHDVNKLNNPSQSVDIAFVECESLDYANGPFGLNKNFCRVAKMYEPVVIFHYLNRKDAICEHIKHQSSFIVLPAVGENDSSIFSVSVGAVTKVEDQFVQHTAFTTKGSSGAVVFALNDSKMVGMSFFRDAVHSYAESALGLITEMDKAVPMLAAIMTVKIQNNESNRFDHYAFMEGAESGAMYTDDYVAQNRSENFEYETQQTIYYNIPTRNALLENGTLVDRFSKLKPKRATWDLITELFKTVTFADVRAWAYYNGDKTIKKSNSIRFDKQKSRLGVLAMQPNAGVGWKDSQGMVFAQVTLSSQLLTHMDKFTDQSFSTQLMKEILSALRLSFYNTKPYYLSYNTKSCLFGVFDENSESEKFGSVAPLTLSDIKKQNSSLEVDRKKKEATAKNEAMAAELEKKLELLNNEA